MSVIQSGVQSLSVMVDISVDRILVPLAIVVGLLGGAMIGTEITKFQHQEMHIPK
ncbi:MAG: hypothetical protein H6895_07470 [Defluviimonas sp.]|uniref:hypothetical protein n=1 Tax=Albidovulum sp. TaxID=1872424 RepID=UPI001DA3CF4E|nr:hypothetical protein [Paracoccaceae bacterium]MCC0063910.1 hypothetical protein [Defluviimonas sp.]